MNPIEPDRREFLQATPGLLPMFSNTSKAALVEQQANDGQEMVIESQRMPEPRVVFPTDGVKRPPRPKRIAAITTAFWKYSHADDIITKFIEGYAIIGRIYQPQCRVVGMYIEQFPDSDIGRGMAARYRIPLFKNPADALTLGRKELAVDGVLLIGEHGDYPLNELGQKLYPRHRLFSEIVKVFQASKRAVPVFNDKHLSYSWKLASWMYEQSRKMKFPMMAGSSVPVAWRRPALDLRPGVRLDSVLAVGAGGVESSGFHILEIMQTFAERRQNGETGVRAVQCLQGKEAWQAAAKGLWNRRLIDAIRPTLPETNGRIAEVDRDAIVFLIEYSDGFRAASYISPRHLREYAVAAQVTGRREPVATWCYLPKPQRDHFSFLCNHIEKMFLTGQPSYPVERTLLVTGILAALMESRHRKGRRIETPHLQKLGYRPVIF